MELSYSGEVFPVDLYARKAPQVFVREPVVGFGDLVKELLPIYETKSKNTYAEFEITTRLYLLPYFKTMPITQVGAQWKAYCAAQRRINPKRKLRPDKKILRLILAHAFDCDLVSKIPRLKLDPFDLSYRIPREVEKNEVESLCRAAPPNLSDLVWLLFYTGMRYSEGRLLKKENVDFEKGLVHLSEAKTKTRVGRVYPLCEEAKEILLKRARVSLGEFLFAMRGNPAAPMCRSLRCFHRARKKAGVTFKLHDLRHSFVTRKARAGVPLALMGKLIGASKRILESVYLHSDSKEWELFRMS